VARAIEVYNGYIAAYAAASQAANPDDPNLPRYPGDPLLTATRFSLQQLKNHGEVQVGAAEGHRNRQPCQPDRQPGVPAR
jgi:hypothetical protein